MAGHLSSLDLRCLTFAMGVIPASLTNRNVGPCSATHKSLCKHVGLFLLHTTDQRRARPRRFARLLKARKTYIRSVLQPNTKLSSLCSGNQRHLCRVCVELYTFKSACPFMPHTAYMVCSSNIYRTASLVTISAAGITSRRPFCLFFFAISYSLPSARPSPPAKPAQVLLLWTA